MKFGLTRKNPIRPVGFSSFKFVPGTSDEHIVALKTMEFNGDIKTFITVFQLDGKELMDISLIGLLLYNFSFDGL